MTRGLLIPLLLVLTLAGGGLAQENLLRNGSFDDANATNDAPAHWQAVDNLVWHWTTDPAAPQRGKVLRIDTDVQQRQAYDWWIRRFVKNEPLANAPAKLPTHEPRYDTIGGLDGGWYWSDFIPVKQGGAYKVLIDAKGPGGAQVFIRGYEKQVPLSFGDESPAVQELFRAPRGEPTHDANGRPIRYRLRYTYTTWFALGGGTEWKTYTHRKPRHPNSREITENVRFIRIMIYPFWPAGEYWFDNVRVVEVEPDPEQASPTADEVEHEEGEVIR